MRKKVVSPAQRRALAHEVVNQELCSQRKACQFLKLARSTFNYHGRPATAAEELLRKRLLELSAGSDGLRGNTKYSATSRIPLAGIAYLVKRLKPRYH